MGVKCYAIIRISGLSLTNLIFCNNLDKVKWDKFFTSIYFMKKISFRFEICQSWVYYNSLSLIYKKLLFKGLFFI